MLLILYNVTANNQDFNGKSTHFYSQQGDIIQTVASKEITIAHVLKTVNKLARTARLLSSGSWYRIVWYSVTNVSDESTASIFRAEFFYPEDGGNAS
jgi:ABC-type cobalamin transport system ATPase subunit